MIETKQWDPRDEHWELSDEEFDQRLDSCWTYVVLEIYSPWDGWPKDGRRPDEWIDNKQVGYCLVSHYEFIRDTALWDIVLYKSKGWVERLREWLAWKLGQWRRDLEARRRRRG